MLHHRSEPWQAVGLSQVNLSTGAENLDTSIRYKSNVNQSFITFPSICNLLELMPYVPEKVLNPRISPTILRSLTSGLVLRHENHQRSDLGV